LCRIRRIDHNDITENFTPLLNQQAEYVLDGSIVFVFLSRCPFESVDSKELHVMLPIHKGMELLPSLTLAKKGCFKSMRQPLFYLNIACSILLTLVPGL
jgi:hypothetical protein